MATNKFIISLLACTLSATGTFSQQRTTYAEDALGKIAIPGVNIIANRINAIHHIDRTKIPSLKKSINEQIRILFSNPLFHPPKGFNSVTSFNAEDDPFAKSIAFPPCRLAFDFYYLENDPKTGTVKKSVDGTLMGIETNNLNHFFRQVGNYWKDCDELKLPLFFEEPPVSDSTNDYIELDFSKYGAPHITPDKPFRIILRNSKPPFIPLTRKEFIQFLIAFEKNKLKETQKQIIDIKKDSLEARHSLDHPDVYTTDAIRKMLNIRIEGDRKNIANEQNEIVGIQKKIKKYQETVNAMPAKEASSAVRIDYNKNAFADPLHALVSAGRREGTALYKINPEYYDKSPGASGAQLIIVYYTLPRPFGSGKLNYLEQKTVDIFNHLDYHALKASMQ